MFCRADLTTIHVLGMRQLRQLRQLIPVHVGTKCRVNCQLDLDLLVSMIAVLNSLQPHLINASSMTKLLLIMLFLLVGP